MVDLNLTDLTENTTPTTDDIIYSVDAPATTKLPRKVTLANIKTLMSDSPTLVTPALGTPSSGTLTSCTGLPITGITSSTSAQLATLISDETGSGALVFGTSPTLTTPKFADLGYIADANGNELIIMDTVTSAVNNIQVANSTTGNSPEIKAVGDDAGVGLILSSKATSTTTIRNGNNAGVEFDNSGATTDKYTTLIFGQTLNRAITVPNAAGTIVLKDTTDTLTNKTIDADGTGNSITNIENADIKASAAIDFSKLAALTDGNILVGNGSNVAVSVNPSGDIDVSNAGVFSINSGVIVNADVSATAAINSTKITPPLRTETASYTLVDTDEILLVNPSTTAFTVTLPAASGRTGKYYKIIYISSTGMPVTIDGNASETINGKTTVLIEHLYTQWELYCDGSNWYGIYSELNLPSEQMINLFEEFMGGTKATAATGIAGELGWTVLGVGTETAAGQALVNHPGVMRYGTGGTSGDDCDAYIGSGGTGIFDADDNFTTTFLIKIEGTLANATRRYGVFLNQVSNSEEGAENACFLFDTATSAKWRCRTRDATTDQTTTDGGADVALSTWYKLKIVRDTATIRFYINDVNIANHSTRVPSLQLCPAISIDSTSSSARTHDIDYFNMRAVVTR